MVFGEVGTIRPSQIISTFGPGAIFDNKMDSMLILGTDSWNERNCRELKDETLLLYLKKSGARRFSNLKKFLVPVSEKNDQDNIPVITFPTWGMCSDCNMLQKRDRSLGSKGVRCKSRQCNSSGTPPETIPVRFVMACINGHLEDFPWYRWVHRNKVDNCSERDCELYLVERNDSSSLGSKVVECRHCNRRESLGAALAEEGMRFVLFEGCSGKRPWLRKDDSRACVDALGQKVYPKGVYKGGTNLYFPMSVRSLTVPPFSGDLAKRIVNLIDEYNLLDFSIEELKKSIPVLLKGENVDEVFKLMREIKRKREDQGIPRIKASEFHEMNLNKFPQRGTDKEDFKTEPIELPESFSKYFENLVLVRRLREVSALTGFYRLESFGYDEDDQRKQSPITNYPEELPTWLPAVENNGEGIFVALKNSLLSAWEKNTDVHNRFIEISTKKNPLPLDDETVVSPKYVLLHSLSHLLIKEISNFAGYSTSSMRERIYCNEETAGILIYTSSSSTDGSLGGLVEQGKKPRFNIMMQRALLKSKTCSMDPLCSHSKPGIGNKQTGSACHACLFLPETSCECMNNLLDRSFVHTTFAREIGFFA
jgi:hypothetical protein